MPNRLEDLRRQKTVAESRIPHAPAAGNVVESGDENFEKYKRLLFRVYEKRIEGVWREFEKNNIEPILIKGWRAAQYYPKPFLRNIGDIDIAVSPRQYEKALDLISRLEEGEIDLHKGLKYLDKVGWEDIFANSLVVNCGDTPIRVLRPEDDLRVICTHWLIDSGVNREKLWDIYYAFDGRASDFDWNRFLETVGAKRRRWLVCAVGVAHKYLGLDVEDTPIADEAKNLPRWLTRTIEREWQSGVKFKYLEATLNSPKEFFQQIKKRIPPNPIQATVEMEGDFDNKPRIIYQIPNMLQRLTPSVRRLTKLLLVTTGAKKKKKSDEK